MPEREQMNNQPFKQLSTEQQVIESKIFIDNKTRQGKDFVIKNSHPVTPAAGSELAATTANGMRFKELWISNDGTSVRLNCRLDTGEVYMVGLTKV